MHPLNPSTATLTPNLTDENAAVQQKSLEQLRVAPHALVSRYRSEFDDHFNPDNAAELFPDYSSSPETRAKYRVAVAAAAGWVSDQAFQQRLSEADNTPVLFTAGGTASGKSTIAGPAAGMGLIVFDSTFSNHELSKRRLQEALASGRNVTLCYVYRDRQEAWIAAGERTREEGAGRTITTHVHLSTHEGAAATIARLTAEFSKNPSVSFRRLDNSTALGLRPVDRAHTETAAPPKLAGEQLAALSPEDLADYVQRIAVAAVNQCRENKQLFLRQYPRLDFRGRELRPSPLLP